MEDYRRRIQESVACYDDKVLEVLCQIAEKTQDCDRIIENFNGKLAVLEYIGLAPLPKLHKIKIRVLDWFRYLLVDNGIDPNDVTADAFLLVLKHNDDEDTYDFDALYDEIREWAKREFGINLIFCVIRDPTARFNEFNFVAGLPGDIDKYKNINVYGTDS